MLQPDRNAALMQLAAEIPAPVLGDLLGLSPQTAVRWVTLAADRRNTSRLGVVTGGPLEVLLRSMAWPSWRAAAGRVSQ